IWYMVGILVVFSPEVAAYYGIEGIKAGDAIMYCYIALCLGDFTSAYLSQVWKSRKKALLLFLIISSIITPLYLFFINGASTELFYFVCGLIGFASGYWAVFVTSASEQFGTNLRATVTTTVPNMVRGSLAILTAMVTFLREQMAMNMIHAIFAVGIFSFAIAFLSLYGIKESYANDLDFIEN